MDLYRIHDPAELRELGWDELGGAAESVLVEWPDRAGADLPEDRWEVELRIPEGSAELRAVTVWKFGAPPPLPSFPMAVAGDR
jgi:tRNA A37 threonylcarbamoyladenosine biosynthesis protein TsaE